LAASILLLAASILLLVVSYFLQLHGLAYEHSMACYMQCRHEAEISAAKHKKGLKICY
jgi:hypothetical protein